MCQKNLAASPLFALSKTFLHPKIHNYSPRNVRLVVTQNTFEWGEIFTLKLRVMFVLSLSFVCLIFVFYPLLFVL